MAQSLSASQSPAHLEVLPNHEATSAGNSSRGATSMIESANTTPSVSPPDPKGGQLDGHANINGISGDRGQNDPWWGNTVLTLDGGGVKGYSSLLILKALMKRIQFHEKELYPNDRANRSAYPLQHRIRKPPRSPSTGTSPLLANEENKSTESEADSCFLPAHYFDYIGGTSTGGLIAIMLGRLLMTVDECCKAYEDLAHRIFGHRRHIHMRNTLVIPRHKYSHKTLEKVIKEIVEKYDHSRDCDANFSQRFSDMCRTIVVAWQERFTETRKPYLFRSYRHPRRRTLDPLERNPDDSTDYPIYKVARATSAAPSYFKAIMMRGNDRESKFIDGGFGANNPSGEVYRSVRQLSNNQQGAIRELVSLGTGKKAERSRKSRVLPVRYAYHAIQLATHSEKTHEDMEERSNQEKFQYTRFNVERELEKIKLDTWNGKRGARTMELIGTATMKYIQNEKVQGQIDEVAKRLVRIRRSRAGQSDSDHWERFCHGVEYGCCIEECRSRGRMSTLDDLRRHFDTYHSFDQDTFNSSLKDCNFYPLFESLS